MTNTNPAVDPRLQRLLGGTALHELRMRLRRVFTRVHDGTGDASAAEPVLLTKLSPVEHEALALLTGRPPRTAKSIRLDIAAMDATLRAAGIAESLRAALEILDGPIVNPTAIKAGIRAAWEQMLTHESWHPLLRAWLGAPSAIQLLKRLSRQDVATGRTLLKRANMVVDRLPASGVPRSQLAAETLGNAHALDRGEATATIILAAWRHQERRTDDYEGDPDQTQPSDERVRDIWARAGVLVNELARPVLYLNLPVGKSSRGEMPGEPNYTSLRRLLRSAPAWTVYDTTVFVCENPNIVAIAADVLGERCAPLVCTDGMPAAAQRVLLTQLSQGGARLAYHGDFDWAGLRIGNYVMQAWSAVPWRFRNSDYEAAVATCGATRHELGSDFVSAMWDDRLAISMQCLGTAIAEEAVAKTLLEDLGDT
uniref:TIGR02679 family protein n=1 Tax=Cupriavidus yeoncheonensis TaxID=1462994 RepID=UPI003F497675